MEPRMGDVEVVEIEPGDYRVTVAGSTVRVVVPAGVGVPGALDDELAGALVAVLAARGEPIPDPLDASAVLMGDPSLLSAIEAHLDAQEGT
jgi:hypothetical protein